MVIQLAAWTSGKRQGRKSLALSFFGMMALGASLFKRDKQLRISGQAALGHGRILCVAL